MEKKEKLGVFSRLVQKLGLSSKNICEYFSTKVIINSAVARKYETPKRVLPGMYVYADGLISAELITGRQVKAVVGYVEGKTVYAVCLKVKQLPWSSDWLEVEASRDMTSGKEATHSILAAAKQKGEKAEAAQWCHDYAYDGVIQGEAFLPSKAELGKLYANKEAINKSLRALNAIELDGWFWSSTEYSSLSVWYFLMSNCTRFHYRKIDDFCYARPVIAFEF